MKYEHIEPPLWPVAVLFAVGLLLMWEATHL